jgi:hypothetical protein
MNTALTETWTTGRFLGREDKQEGNHEFDERDVVPTTGGLSEFLCARRDNLTPTGKLTLSANNRAGKRALLANRCSSVRSKHLFLRPDLPFPRQARASRVKSAA